MLSERCMMSPIASLLVDSKAMSVLDLGIGDGLYGFIARRYLDCWLGRAFKRDWKVKIDGIEYYKEFHTPIYDFIYDKVYWGDVLEILPKLGNYDAIITSQLIEHLKKEDGWKLLDLVEKHCKRRIIIGTPTRFFKTGWETFQKCEHQSLWTSQDFRNRGYKVSVIHDLEILAWKDK